MSDTLTYSLLADEPDSDGYFRTIHTFASDWLREAQSEAGELCHAYAQFRSAAGLRPRTLPELSLELLVLGVLLREHGAQATGFPQWANEALQALNDRSDSSRPGRQAGRQAGLQAKKTLLALRGLLSSLDRKFKGTVREGEIEAIAQARAAGMPVSFDGEPDLGCTLFVRRLVQWLITQGHHAQAARLTEWQTFIESFDPAGSQEIILQAILLADNFAEQGQVLARYTRKVDDHLRSTRRATAWSFDAGRFQRRAIEYHLGMLGVEILNRVYRADFLAAPRKVVVVPECMRARSGAAESAACLAGSTTLGQVCANCTPVCRVRQISELGQAHGFSVFIQAGDPCKDDLKAFKQMEGAGVVGLACALTAWDRGWELNDLGVPAQGLLLDFAGCCDRWHTAGRGAPAAPPPSANLRVLLEILGAE